MPKAKYPHVNFIPQSYNFSDIQPDNLSEDTGIDPSDGEEEVTKELSSLNAEKMILGVLSNLTDREKIIFLCQIVRDDGYRIDHLALSQAMKISRSLYMILLNQVKIKSRFILQRQDKR